MIQAKQDLLHALREAVAELASTLGAAPSGFVPSFESPKQASHGDFAVTLAYSLRLQHVVVVDVMVLAFGFMVRAIAGTVAIGVEPSVWLTIAIAVSLS